MEYVNRLEKQGTNSTHFTTRCGCAITDSERYCPSCKEPVIGYDAESEYGCGRIRWAYATSHWRN